MRKLQQKLANLQQEKLHCIAEVNFQLLQIYSEHQLHHISPIWPCIKWRVQCSYHRYFKYQDNSVRFWDMEFWHCLAAHKARSPRLVQEERWALKQIFQVFPPCLLFHCSSHCFCLLRLDSSPGASHWNPCHDLPPIHQPEKVFWRQTQNSLVFTSFIILPLVMRRPKPSLWAKA